MINCIIILHYLINITSHLCSDFCSCSFLFIMMIKIVLELFSVLVVIKMRIVLICILILIQIQLLSRIQNHSEIVYQFIFALYFEIILCKLVKS